MLFAIAATAMIVLPGCASIFTKSTYPLLIQSTPQDATILVTNQRGVEYARGTTPITVKLKASDGFFSKAEYNVRFSKPGYEDMVLPVTFSIEGWYFGNILLGGIIGMLIVDPATGAMWRIDQDTLSATLPPTQASLRIVNVNDLDDETKAKLVPIETTGK